MSATLCLQRENSMAWLKAPRNSVVASIALRCWCISMSSVRLSIATALFHVFCCSSGETVSSTSRFLQFMTILLIARGSSQSTSTARLIWRHGFSHGPISPAMLSHDLLRYKSSTLGFHLNSGSMSFASTLSKGCWLHEGGTTIVLHPRSVPKTVIPDWRLRAEGSMCVTLTTHVGRAGKPNSPGSLDTRSSTWLICVRFQRWNGAARSQPSNKGDCWCPASFRVKGLRNLGRRMAMARSCMLGDGPCADAPRQ
mmetsp:Transcript_33848/g.104497  ORF Transcript_33848/g.104497 Transcript_33848/m.104497 type:complete len:254 (-) Transcript_33848:18-779(-)